MNAQTKTIILEIGQIAGAVATAVVAVPGLNVHPWAIALFGVATLVATVAKNLIDQNPPPSTPATK